MKRMLMAVAILLGLAGVASASHCNNLAVVQRVVNVEHFVVPQRVVEFVEVPNLRVVEKQIVQRNVVRRNVVVQKNVVVQRNVVRRQGLLERLINGNNRVQRQVVVEKVIVH